MTTLPEPLDVHPAWMDRAACRTAPLALFFPHRGDDTSMAKALCATCPVRQDCLEYALDAGLSLTGIWGGTSRRQRIQIRKADA